MDPFEIASETQVADSSIEWGRCVLCNRRMLDIGGDLGRKLVPLRCLLCIKEHDTTDVGHTTKDHGQ